MGPSRRIFRLAFVAGSDIVYTLLQESSVWVRILRDAESTSSCWLRIGSPNSIHSRQSESRPLLHVEQIASVGISRFLGLSFLAASHPLENNSSHIALPVWFRANIWPPTFVTDTV